MAVAERQAPQIDGAAARRAMIDGQLRVSGVNDPVLLAAIDRLPREDFVPATQRGVAYIDRRLPLGHGRYLNPPLTHALMLSEAMPTPDDTALLVGGGTGYLAALLAPLVGRLTVVESVAELAAQAPQKAGTWIDGPLTAGAPKAAPFSLMVIDGAVEQVSPKLQAQLAEGGRLVTGLLTRGVTRLAVGRKEAGTLGLLPLAEADIAVLPEFAAPKGWSF